MLVQEGNLKLLEIQKQIVQIEQEAIRVPSFSDTIQTYARRERLERELHESIFKESLIIRQLKSLLHSYPKSVSSRDEEKIRKARSEALTEEHKNYYSYYQQNSFAIDIFAENRIWDLFGGRSGFEKLPVLDIGDEYEDYISFIGPEDMTAPIMRGIDSSRREFFAIRVESEGKLMVQTFHRRYTDNVSWVSEGWRSKRGFTGNMGMLSRGVMDLDVYEDLTTLISTGSLENWRGKFKLAHANPPKPVNSESDSKLGTVEQKKRETSVPQTIPAVTVIKAGSNFRENEERKFDSKTGRYCAPPNRNL